MNRKIHIFSTLKWITASMVLALFTSGCSRQMAINEKTNQVRYVQTNESHARPYAVKVNTDNLSLVATKTETKPVSSGEMSPKQEKISQNITKHSFVAKRTAKTRQSETINATTGTKYASITRHHSSVRNADIRVGGLISGIVLLILGCILYALPGPVGYILGTIVVVIAVFIIVFAII